MSVAAWAIPKPRSGALTERPPEAETLACLCQLRSDKLPLNPQSHPFSFKMKVAGCLSPGIERNLISERIRRSYESLRYRSHSQPCGHWTRRRREDATD